MPAQFLAVSSVIKKHPKGHSILFNNAETETCSNNQLICNFYSLLFICNRCGLIDLPVGLWFGHLQIADAHHIKRFFFPDFILFDQD